MAQSTMESQTPQTFELAKESKKPEVQALNFRGDVVLLSTILHQMCDALCMMPHTVDKETEGLVGGLKATLHLLKKLWNMPDPQWMAIRNTVCVGMVKDTKKHGNTSVSMGFAKNFFDKNPDENVVLFLNCGTGGIKYQLYRRNMKTGIVFLDKEFKPKDGASPNSLPVEGLYKPKTPVALDVNNTHFGNEKTACPGELGLESLAGVPIRVFVTGSIREEWEKASADNKQVFEKLMSDFFAGFGTPASSDGSYSHHSRL